MGDARWLLLLALGAVASACTAPRSNTARTHTDAWPLIREQTLVNGSERIQALGPIYEDREDKDGTITHAVRPFYTYTYDPSKLEEDRLALYPLGRHRTQRRPEGGPDDDVRKDQVWLLPLFYYSYFSPQPGEWEEDWFAPFPLVWGGNDHLGQSHFSVFPLAGNIRGLLGRDEIDYVLLPFYVHSREGEENVWYFPWPLARYGFGPDYETYALLPLFSHTTYTGQYTRNAILWPIVNWGTEGEDSAYPRKYWTVFPLIGRRWSAVSEQTSVLWPFFHYGRFDITDTTIIDAPWPIFRWADGINYEEFRLWPLYAQWRHGKDWNYNVIWPIYWNLSESDSQGQYVDRSIWVLPVWWSRTRHYTPNAFGEELTRTRAMLFPLARYVDDVDGNWSLTLPAPLPYLSEEFERAYGEIFRVIALEGGVDHTTVELLWGWARWHDEPEINERALHPLFRYAGTGTPETRETEWDFLYGLLGHYSGPEESYLRLLWFITIPTGSGHHATDSKADSGSSDDNSSSDE